MIIENYLIAVCFNSIGVSSMKLAITPKRVGAN